MQASALERTHCENLLYVPGENKFFPSPKDFDPVLATTGVIMSVDRSPPSKIAPRSSETNPALSGDLRSGSAQIQNLAHYIG